MKRVVKNPEWVNARYAFEAVDKDGKIIKPTPVSFYYLPRFNSEEDAIKKTNPIFPFVEIESP